MKDDQKREVVLEKWAGFGGLIFETPHDVDLVYVRLSCKDKDQAMMQITCNPACNNSFPVGDTPVLVDGIAEVFQLTSRGFVIINITAVPWGFLANMGYSKCTLKVTSYVEDDATTGGMDFISVLLLAMGFHFAIEAVKDVLNLLALKGWCRRAGV